MNNEMIETVGKLTDGMNELICEAADKTNRREILNLNKAAVGILKSINLICQTFKEGMLDEVIEAKIQLDDWFGCNVLNVNEKDLG